MNMSDAEKKILDRIKVLMKNHGITKQRFVIDEFCSNRSNVA